MSVQLRAYLSIEKSLNARLTSSLRPLVAKYRRKVLTAVAKKDWEQATKIANEIDLAPVYLGNLGYIRYASYAAMLFGASRLTKNLKKSTIMVDDYSVDVGRATSLLRKQIVGNVQKAMTASMLKEIDALHGEATVTKADRLAEPFVSFGDEGYSMLQLVSQLHTSRLSAFGFTAEANVLGVRTYQITEQLDNRVCPVCAEMHGKTFDVMDARNALEDILDTDNPDDLATMQPWPGQSTRDVEALAAMTDAELVDRNWHIPPYHPGCRGLLVAVGDAEELPDQSAQDVPSDIESTAVGAVIAAVADLVAPVTAAVDSRAAFSAAIGFEVGEDVVALWNSVMDISITDAMSGILTMDDIALLADAGMDSDVLTELSKIAMK